MSYDLKGFNVERDGVVIAVINKETAKLDFEEGCSTYRNYAVKKLRELGVWDDEKDAVIMAKLDLEKGDEGKGTPDPSVFSLDKLNILRDDNVVAAIDLETGKLVFGEGLEDCLEPAVAMLNKLELWNDETERVNIEDLRERYPNEVFAKIKPSDSVAIGAAIAKEHNIVTVKALVAAMQSHISETCPPMSRRLGDKTLEVLKWIEKHDKVRKEVLKK